MTFPANDNRVRSTLSALDLSCRTCKAGVGEPCRYPKNYGGYRGHHAEREHTLRDVGDANAARAILRAICRPLQHERTKA